MCRFYAVCLRWLHYRGVPHPKGTTKKHLVEQVKHAQGLKQPLDEERLKSMDATTAKSYVSIDSIAVSAAV